MHFRRMGNLELKRKAQVVGLGCNSSWFHWIGRRVPWLWCHSARTFLKHIIIILLEAHITFFWITNNSWSSSKEWFASWFWNGEFRIMVPFFFWSLKSNAISTLWLANPSFMNSNRVDIEWKSSGPETEPCLSYQEAYDVPIESNQRPKWDDQICFLWPNHKSTTSIHR
jgi:hypothetical protein